MRLYGESDYREDFRRYLVAASLGQREEPPRVRFAELKERVRPLSLDCEEVAGIPICYDEREGFMHHKFLVVDGRAVWTGSTNMTWNAFARNNENSLLLPSPPWPRGTRGSLRPSSADRRKASASPWPSPWRRWRAWPTSAQGREARPGSPPEAAFRGPKGGLGGGLRPHGPGTGGSP